MAGRDPSVELNWEAEQEIQAISLHCLLSLFNLVCVGLLLNLSARLSPPLPNACPLGDSKMQRVSQGRLSIPARYIVAALVR